MTDEKILEAVANAILDAYTNSKDENGWRECAQAALRAVRENNNNLCRTCLRPIETPIGMQTIVKFDGELNAYHQYCPTPPKEK